MILPTTQVKASSDQVSCDLAGEAAILDLQNGIYYGLDPVGARIWELIQTPRNTQEVVSLLLDEYDVDAAQCQDDVLALLGQLSERGLISIRDHSSSAGRCYCGSDFGSGGRMFDLFIPFPTASTPFAIPNSRAVGTPRQPKPSPYEEYVFVFVITGLTNPFDP